MMKIKNLQLRVNMIGIRLNVNAIRSVVISAEPSRYNMNISAASFAANFYELQQAWNLIATLNLTAYLWPEQTNVKDGDEYDFIVVGAGSAGCVVAARLVEAGHHVMLIEGGGDPPLPSMIPSLYEYLLKTKEDWNYTTSASECHIDNNMGLNAAKMLSGSNGHNALVYVRGNPHDYELWAEAVNDKAWSYEEVLTYFKKSENLKDVEILQSVNSIFHGTNGPLEVTKIYDYDGYTVLDGYFDAVTETGNNFNIDYNGYDSLGYGYIIFSSTECDGPRQSTAYAYLTPIKDNPKLHVLKNTIASKVIFDEFKNAVSVEVITEDNKTIALKAKKEIILSAGAFNSPKLLMLSGIGPKDHLQSVGLEVIADLPVGKNLQDHPGIWLQYQMEESDAPPPPPGNPYKTTPKNAFVGFAAVDKSQSYPDYETYNYVQPHDSIQMLASCSNFYGLQPDICQQFYDVAKGRNTLFTFLNLLQPKSRGELLLKTKNPKDKPSVNLNFYSEKSDVEAIVDSIEDFTKLSDTKYFRSVNASLLYLDLPGCSNFELGSRDYWRCFVQCMVLTSYHYAGTCAMGAVVDSKLRVHNVQSLRVADASVMPIITSGNTNAPTIMIGEKAAEMIIEEHKLQANDNCY